MAQQQPSARIELWRAPPLASITETAARPTKGLDAGVTAAGGGSAAQAAAAAAAAGAPDKPAHDVVAGAMARAASQSTIHPLDTMKVRMQAGSISAGKSSSPSAAAHGASAAASPPKSVSASLQRGFAEVASLYKGVVSAATGAGIIIGAYFAFYSTTKGFLRRRTDWKDGHIAFVSGATAAVGSGVVKVPIAVCIRSVQAGVYPNVAAAARSITAAAGPRGLFTGFVPTLLEDVPDMAVKFAVYETMRLTHVRLSEGRTPSTLEDLVMGGAAGAAAAAATTPLDVVKTRMMCSASSRPTLLGAARSVLAEGDGARAFFRGVGPRALSNGINSAVFFCFFEAFRRVLQQQQQQKQQLQLQAAASQMKQQQPAGMAEAGARTRGKAASPQQELAAAHSSMASAAQVQQQQLLQQQRQQKEQQHHHHDRQHQQPLLSISDADALSSRPRRGASSDRFACLSLAVPLPLPLPGGMCSWNSP